MNHEIEEFRRVRTSRAALAVMLVIALGLGCHAASGGDAPPTPKPTPTPKPAPGPVRPPSTARPLGFSGMARYGQAAFLVVHDTKVPSRDPRVSILKVGTPETGPSLVTVDVDWAANEPANDLESACVVPGTTDEFLLCESGYFAGKFGRLFHVQMTHHTGGGYHLAVKHVAMLPKFSDEIEGIACVARRDGSRLLIFGERGGRAPLPPAVAATRPAVKPPTLHWATWDPSATQIVAKPAARPLAAPPIAHPADVGQRQCADVYVDEQNAIWCASAVDPGDAGPFRSVVYRAATVNPDAADPIDVLTETKAAWVLDGVKVEAIGGPVVPRSALSVASDDEAYGGVWRPLFPAP